MFFLIFSCLYLTISKSDLDKIAAQKVIDSTQAGASSYSSLTADSLLTPPRPGSSNSFASEMLTRKRKPSNSKVRSLSLVLLVCNLILCIIRRTGQMRSKRGPTNIWLSGSDAPPCQSRWSRTLTWKDMLKSSTLTPMSLEERRSRKTYEETL